MYTVKGSNGELGFKVGLNDFPRKLFNVKEVKDILSWFN